MPVATIASQRTRRAEQQVRSRAARKHSEGMQVWTQQVLEPLGPEQEVEPDESTWAEFA